MKTHRDDNNFAARRRDRFSHRELTAFSLSILFLLIAAVTAVPADLPIALGGEADCRRSSGTIAEGTRWATTWIEVKSPRPGPTILVVGGVHGNEPAGARAATQIACWSVQRGRLVVIPRANRVALAAGRRITPDVPADQGNLNRNFPITDAGCAPRGDLASALWRFVDALKPDWVLDLHEGTGFRASGSKSVGSSVIVHPTPETERIAGLMLDAINATVSDKGKRFVLLRITADGTLAQAAAKCLCAGAMIVETTSKGQPQALRARQQRIMVNRVLEEIGTAAGQADTMVRLGAGKKALEGRGIRAAIYAASGTGNSTPGKLEKALAALPKATLRRVCPADIRSGALSQFDLVVFGGGSGSVQARALGVEGRTEVRRFLRKGGGFVGICGGSYLATSGYDWGLKIVDAETVDRQHWRRGTGKVRIELTDAGKEILGAEEDLVTIFYANGPLLADSGLEDVPDFCCLAVFRDEIARNGAPEGVMAGTPAVVCGEFGLGRVICFSPHPEKTESLWPLLVRGAAWAGGEGPTKTP